MTATPEHPLSCAACQVIDEADGTVDGNLFPVLASRLKNENRLLAVVQRTQDKAADRITNFAGSLKFVYIHSLWFALWIVANIGILGAGAEFDKFPFGLLTMIVSLEAIFLATFVMVSQNRQAARADLRAELDFETNLRSEIWSVHIGHALGIDTTHVEEVVTQAIAGSRRNVTGG